VTSIKERYKNTESGYCKYCEKRCSKEKNILYLGNFLNYEKFSFSEKKLSRITGQFFLGPDLVFILRVPEMPVVDVDTVHGEHILHFTNNGSVRRLNAVVSDKNIK
jgi:hypothetical protein